MEEVAVANYVVDANGHLYRMTASDKKWWRINGTYQRILK